MVKIRWGCNWCIGEMVKINVWHYFYSGSTFWLSKNILTLLWAPVGKMERKCIGINHANKGLGFDAVVTFVTGNIDTDWPEFITGWLLEKMKGLIFLTGFSYASFEQELLYQWLLDETNWFGYPDPLSRRLRRCGSPRWTGENCEKQRQSSGP